MDSVESGFFRSCTDSEHPVDIPSDAPRPHRILVVEDEMLPALSLASTLEMAGFEVVGPACRLNEALELLDEHGCSLAILDVNLGRDETSEELAHRLKERGIPFFVTSGYSAQDRPAVYRGVPSFAKPVGVRAILSAVQAIKMR